MDYNRDKLEENNIVKEVETSFLEYSMSVIISRALPDLRDGLKPVHRRILYSMYESGYTPDKAHKKSARIVGDVMGKYHPHGDSSIYEAMVRMAQDFSYRYMLVDGHGNFGNIEGYGAAAMRYTEARLSKYADYLLKDINKKTVGFVPNFDDEEYEPTILPAYFPNLLVNGGTGISAGYATEIPPHNITEVINATIYRINHPTCTLKEIMNIVQGPDFPTGGIVQGKDGFLEAFKTGRGKCVVKSKTEIVETKTGKQIIVTEIPFEVVKSDLVRSIDQLIFDKKVDGIVEVRDESDKEVGIRIAIDLKKDANTSVINLSTKLKDEMVVIIYSNKQIEDFIKNQKEVLKNAFQKRKYSMSKHWKR